MYETVHLGCKRGKLAESSPLRSAVPARPIRIHQLPLSSVKVQVWLRAGKTRLEGRSDEAQVQQAQSGSTSGNFVGLEA